MSIMSPGDFRILCVEDEPEILRDIVEELRDHGFQVEAAANAEAALPCIAAQVPDLILCDMQMPGMSGLELLEDLRARGDAASSVPFVFLTAFGDRATMISGRKAGADDYLVKPVDYDLLIAAVESHLHNAVRRADQHKPVEPSAEAAKPTGGQLLLEALGEAPAGTRLVVAKADNPIELARRFAHMKPARLEQVCTRFAQRFGLRMFLLNTHAIALLGNCEEDIAGACTWLAQLRLRDYQNAVMPKVRIRWSLVRSETGAASSNAALLDRMLDAARLLQREGGNRSEALGSAEMQQFELANSIRAGLINSIRHGELYVCFQPKISARDGTAVAAEVLVRWASPMLGQLAPGTFIPIIERAGLLPHLTDWVLLQTARAQITLAAQGLPAKLAVNIGATEFNADLPTRIDRIFREIGAIPELLELEITETSVLTDPDAANNIVKTLQLRGITVALDDFGTGFSSLSYLQACHVDAIKIDRSFVSHVTDREGDQKIIQGMIGIGRLLALEIIAEGVETTAQHRYLSDHGCTTLQGYLLSRPLPLEDYLTYLETNARLNADGDDPSGTRYPEDLYGTAGGGQG